MKKIVLQAIISQGGAALRTVIFNPFGVRFAPEKKDLRGFENLGGLEIRSLFPRVALR